MPLNDQQAIFKSYPIRQLTDALTVKLTACRLMSDRFEPCSVVMPMDLSSGGDYVSESLLLVTQPEPDSTVPVTAIRYGHNGKVQIQEYDLSLRDSLRRAFEESGPGFGHSLMARPCLALLEPALCPEPTPLPKALEPLRAFSTIKLTPRLQVRLF